MKALGKPAGRVGGGIKEPEALAQVLVDVAVAEGPVVEEEVRQGSDAPEKLDGVEVRANEEVEGEKAAPATPGGTAQLEELEGVKIGGSPGGKTSQYQTSGPEGMSTTSWVSSGTREVEGADAGALYLCSMFVRRTHRLPQASTCLWRVLSRRHFAQNYS